MKESGQKEGERPGDGKLEGVEAAGGEKMAEVEAAEKT